ncbi:poly-beta-1,6 N-acetyl-D-glucosamine synthase [Actinobacillus succinogenes]|uniref:Poly-beta-1,6-N-acetyl-D-glucosamine synthase n=1 Tax=Actinobacillus succinogenes (strain ATCC 55618 / DSM 22257 / CCUG 43843 / 130Z) TaxID=339671 RepID=A6VMN0_ACTSZ|nr:poly-beta-1,6-N-acetyl-D-glucosamine synthase [Actinobacillus succinogenes]ABR74227.1 glycosyl transferase family 2 [Actinobacillus succinogenes 130Z]PHI39344.1 poly-beta-1,6 N-acetyl-D-glucosamine synthase [Actinobacillus succinogenes]
MSWFDILNIMLFMYPALMAIYWTIAAGYYYFFIEGKFTAPKFSKMDMADIPMVSIMIPCYNEADNLDDAIPYLLKLKYPKFELIFINDGSKDETGEIIDRWAQKDNRIVALHQENAGKASALNYGLTVAKGKYIGCIDGDAVLDYRAVDYMVQALESNPQYGAVTGNPRVRNRSTILGCLQTSEFSSIIGLIKRAQSVMGTIFTVSGVCCLFKAEAMQKIGGWSTNMITEDIDVSWKLQTAGYNIVYEPRALCWTLMPETIRGLFKQRLRWAQGGAETIIKYFPIVWRLGNRRLWPMYLEYFVTAVWAYALIAVLCINTYIQITQGTFNVSVFRVLMTVLFFSFFWQYIFSLYIDSRYEKGLFRYSLYCIWYPYVYWLLNMLTLVFGIPKAIFRNKSKLAVWTSPDRGV